MANCYCRRLSFEVLDRISTSNKMLVQTSIYPVTWIDNTVETVIHAIGSSCREPRTRFPACTRYCIFKILLLLMQTLVRFDKSMRYIFQSTSHVPSGYFKLKHRLTEVLFVSGCYSCFPIVRWKFPLYSFLFKCFESNKLYSRYSLHFASKFRRIHLCINCIEINQFRKLVYRPHRLRARTFLSHSEGFPVVLAPTTGSGLSERWTTIDRFADLQTRPRMIRKLQHIDPSN